MSNNEIAIIEDKVGGLKALVEKTTVKDDKELAKVSDIVKQIKDIGKYIQTEKEKLTIPAKAIIKEAGEKYDRFIKECDSAEIILKMKARDYLEAQEKARITAKAKIVARVEKGTMKVETAVKKIEELPTEKRGISTGESALSIKKRAVVKIEDEESIPDEFWMVNEMKVKREALERYKAGTEQIPGVVIELVSSIASF